MKNRQNSAFILKAISILALATTFVTGAIAAPLQGEACTTAAYISSPKESFNCPSLGKVTIQQIYEKGWRVVGLYDLDAKNLWMLIIEKQKE